MSISFKHYQNPVRGVRKRDMRNQYAALCYRRSGGKVQILLITSRDTGRWIIPKGWPMDGKTPSETALTEAWEEAGVAGKAKKTCVGIYTYRKLIGGDALPCVVMVYPVKVTSLAPEFPEYGQRKRKWVSRKKATKMVLEPELARIIRNFDPDKIKQSALS